MKLSEVEKRYLVNLIESGEQIPEDYKYLLFPNLQEEYELTYAGKMRREDILAGEDGTLPVPLNWSVYLMEKNIQLLKMDGEI